MSELLLELKSSRDRARYQRDEMNSTENRKSYESLKKEFKRQLEKAKAEFFSEPSSAKEMWDQLRKHALGPSQHSKANDVPDEAAANRFNEYFANVGRGIAAELAEHRDNTRPSPHCVQLYILGPACHTLGAGPSTGENEQFESSRL